MKGRHDATPLKWYNHLTWELTMKWILGQILCVFLKKPQFSVMFPKRWLSQTLPQWSPFIILPHSFAKSQQAASYWVNGMLPPSPPAPGSGSQCKIGPLEFWTGGAAGGSRLFLSSLLLRFSKGPLSVVGKCSHFLMRVKASCLWPLQCALTRSWWELLCGSLWHGWKALRGTDWSHLPSISEHVDTLKRKTLQLSECRKATMGMNVCFCACVRQHLFAGSWKAEWTGHKVVFRPVIVVLHHKAHQGQIRNLHLEAQRAVPARVEACRGRTRAVNTGRRNPFENELSCIILARLLCAFHSGHIKH